MTRPRQITPDGSRPRVFSFFSIEHRRNAAVRISQRTLGQDWHVSSSRSLSHVAGLSVRMTREGVALVVEALELERPARTQRPHPARQPIAAAATSLQRKFSYPSHRAPVPPRNHRLTRALFSDRGACTAAGGEKLKDPGSGLLSGAPVATFRPRRGSG